jgi:Tfp pilus assembly protein PilV
MLQNERGFTLIEAIIAVLVCTVGLVAMAELMAVTLRLQQLGRNQTSAARLAQDKVDELSTLLFTDPNNQMSCGGSLTANNANHFDTPRDDNGTPNNAADDTVTKGYTRRWVVSAGPDGDLNLRTVTVTVIPDVTDRRTAAPYELVTIIRQGLPGAACP